LDRIDDLDAAGSSTSGARDQIAACLGIDADSLRKAVQDLYRHRMAVYWLDFLLSIFLGYGALMAFPIRKPLTLFAAAMFLCAVVGCYRAAVFIHELAHVRDRQFAAFRFAWSVMCGVPQLIPSFLYEMHIAHHAPRTYGSAHDGEYRALARLPWTGVAGLIGASLLMPAACMLRFLVLAPLSWILPQVRASVLARASALMIIDSDYRRPINPGGTPVRWLVQETACFLWCITLLSGTVYGIIPIARIVEVYAVVASVSLINGLRVVVAHRYLSTGEPMTFAQQVLDTNSFPSLSAELWAPVGLRYHAVHHLLPSLPYHALPEAHRRIMARIPPDSPYRATLRASYFSVLSELLGWSRAVP
jgi:fatty acid desaturase